MIKYSFPAAPVTYMPPANTPAVLANELIDYQACPLCESKAFRPLRSADCSHHPRYSQELSRTMHWSQCAACQHVFRSGYYTEAALNIVFRGTNESQVVGYDLERQRYVSAQMIEKVLPYQTGGTWGLARHRFCSRRTSTASSLWAWTCVRNRWKSCADGAWQPIARMSKGSSCLAPPV